MFTAAIQRGRVEVSPIISPNKGMSEESRPRICFLTRNGLARLHEAEATPLKPILVLAVETGMRKEEVLSLRLMQIDLRRQEVYLEITKTSCPRCVC